MQGRPDHIDGNRLVEATSRSVKHDESGVFWRTAPPEEVARIRALNARIGVGIQPLLSRAFIVFVLGIPAYVALRTLFRLRITGMENLQKAGEKAILASRHFFEWDPAVVFFGLYEPWGLRDPRWAPHLMAGHFWTRTPFRRAASWLISNLALVRGEGEDQVAFERVKELMKVPGPRIVGMFPTGPIGRGPKVPPRPGVAYLAQRVPDVPVVPVTVVGLRQVTVAAVLKLQRPVVTIAVGEPFKARDLPEGTLGIARICDRIDKAWRDLEAAIQKS